MTMTVSAQVAFDYESANAERFAHERRTMTPQELRFRKVLTNVAKGLITEREAWAETHEILGLVTLLNPGFPLTVRLPGQGCEFVYEYVNEAEGSTEAMPIGLYRDREGERNDLNMTMFEAIMYADTKEA